MLSLIANFYVHIKRKVIQFYIMAYPNHVYPNHGTRRYMHDQSRIAYQTVALSNTFICEHLLVGISVSNFLPNVVSLQSLQVAKPGTFSELRLIRISSASSRVNR